MSDMRYRHLFGPVNSRRLGMSLGVDLVPYKYCPLNCVYCEVQHTTHLTMERREFFPVEEICSELKDFLSQRPPLDYITFSGAGEPTLYSRIGDIVSFLKSEYPAYKLALLTNGVLLGAASLRREILPCDLILPSLDACRQKTFEQLNRPHPALRADELVQALVTLRSEYHGAIWLELFIIAGVNDSEAELDCLAAAIKRIKPDKVQLNSLDRPGAEDWVRPAGIRVLNRVKARLEEALARPVEIIAKAHAGPAEVEIPDDVVQSISAILLRRPCTAEDLAATLTIHINEISKILRQLKAESKIGVKRGERGVFYTWID